MSHTSKPFVILLVEDEKADACLIKWALKENQMQADLHHVQDGYEALKFLRRIDTRFKEMPRPDLILLDLNMPRMNGLECLAAIKQDKSLSDIPVVMLSTSYAERDKIDTFNLGAVD